MIMELELKGGNWCNSEPKWHSVIKILIHKTINLTSTVTVKWITYCPHLAGSWVVTPAQKPRRNGLNCIRRRWIWFSLFLFAFLRDLFIFPRWCWHLYYPKNPNCDEHDSGSQWGSILSRYFLPRFTIVPVYSPWIPAFCNPRCHWDFLSLSSLWLFSPNEGSWPIVLGWVSMTNVLLSLTSQSRGRCRCCRWQLTSFKLTCKISWKY